ncbi:transcription initiation protein [Flavobacterium sp. HSC-61S13]|uniref:transcription initiation protein n=1 Tax=Flavobacterium sp. HSC-61S13 TaxID=2910963 RepID=UPI0020A04F50|nr:transcription initiation protein [Flavobacterium sp. HSC-61S13]MCP1996842.1 hypothetical protein [Flavobacterium sp. HSC-61S13]
MKKFAFIFRLNGASPAVPTAEQLAERLTWLSDLIDNQTVVDRGNTLTSTPARRIDAEGGIEEDVCDDYSFFISGYLVIQAQNIDQAVTIALSNPIYKVGGTIEVREVVQRP